MFVVCQKADNFPIFWLQAQNKPRMIDKFINYYKQEKIILDDFDIRQDYDALYHSLNIMDENTCLQSAIYMLYYTIVKEIDTISRIENMSCFLTVSSEYQSQLSDSNLYELKSCNDNIELISPNEFREIIQAEKCILKIGSFRKISPDYSFSDDKIIECNLDGTPVFKITKGENIRMVRLAIAPSFVVPSGDIQRFTNKLLNRIIASRFVNNTLEKELKNTLNFYLTKGVAFASKINSWLSILLESTTLEYCITDQTLPPAASFISHEIRRHNIPLLVLQHQRNMVLSNLYPLLLPDFKLASVYYSWFSKAELNKHYEAKLAVGKFVHVSDIPFRKVTKKQVKDKVQSGKKCLLIINEAFDAYINGASIYRKVHALEVENMCKLLHSLGFQVFVRDYPNSNRVLAIPNTYLDDSNGLDDTFGKYDFYLTDRVGNSIMEILELQGFLFVFPHHYQSYLSQYYESLKVNDVFANGDNATIRQLLSLFDLLVVLEENQK